MASIRVGIIGLSSNATTSWASTAHLPYLLASNGKYELTALCNSSKAAAEAAVAAYKLPPSTKAYGDPQDLANDPDIDLVVCSVRVDNHYKTTKPSIAAGKSVFVEWPLASNVEDAAELAALAREKGVKSMVALQGRVSPIYIKVKDLLRKNKIGKVLNTHIVASGGTRTRSSISEGLKYFFDRKVGGNMLTIGFAHMIDSIHSVLGPFISTTSHLSVTRLKVDVLSSTGEVLGTVSPNTPDYIIQNAKLPNHNGAPLSIIFRRGPAFPNTPGFVWSIQGETGEIRVESAGPSFQAFDGGSKILLESFETGEVQDVDWEPKQTQWRLPARDIATLYEEFASGEKRSFADFNEAVQLHKELEEMWKSWDAEGSH